MSAERLQKVLASAGVASRRDCEGLISAGRVSVNGRVVQEPGTRVDLDEDVVEVDGNPVRRPTERTYLVLNKPVGFVSTVDDPQGRPTVLDLVDVPARVYPVGRLDVDSEGLLLLTDDGELTHQLTHPRFEIEKEYRALLDRPLDSEALRQWREGVLLNGEPTAPAWVDLSETTEEGPWFRVVLREGRKRQIREVARLLGYEVLRLIRVREGDLHLADLPLREWRPLTPQEIASLHAHVASRPRDAASSAKPERSARPRSEGRRDDDRPARPPRDDDRRDDDRADRPRSGGYAPRRDEGQGGRGGYSGGPRRDEGQGGRGGYSSGYSSGGPRRDEGQG
ncbi:rRNA pseudouridine synthase, partial [Oscillochloris sp. ZM17-4]|uniref:pseudouridine synthase n=1 Tax=Oscillochloris sp. ZM17-4 TaxID=2866714 RepID=UPI001C73CB21|nr:rRNA pseudouridine synthase [Oscillochloris sp. ZM17-4]